MKVGWNILQLEGVKWTEGRQVETNSITVGAKDSCGLLRGERLICVCFCMCGCVHKSTAAQGGQERASDPMELELRCLCAT